MRISILVDTVMICILVWLFWGEPDNWDHLNIIVEYESQEIQYQNTQPRSNKPKDKKYTNFGIGSYRLNTDIQ